jgi:hypothetical protein
LPPEKRIVKTNAHTPPPNPYFPPACSAPSRSKNNRRRSVFGAMPTLAVGMRFFLLHC